MKNKDKLIDALDTMEKDNLLWRVYKNAEAKDYNCPDNCYLAFLCEAMTECPIIWLCSEERHTV